MPTISKNKRCREVVINKQYGGFGLSYKGMKEYYKRKGIEVAAYDYDLTSKVKTYVTDKEMEEKDRLGAAFVHYEDANNLDENTRYLPTREIPRDDPDLVAVVKRLGSAVNGPHAALRIVEIPADVEWHVEEYDGMEHIAENHRVWG